MSTETVIDEPSPSTEEPTPQNRRVGRRISRILLWTATVGYLGFALWRLFGWEAHWVVVVAMAYTPYVMLGGVVLLVWSLLQRSGIALTAVMLGAMALIAVVVPRMISMTPPNVAGAELTVMTTNLRVGVGDADQVMSLVEEHGVDVLSVQELTETVLAELTQLGITEWFPHREFETSNGDAGGTGVFSRLPLTVLDPVPGRFFMPVVQLDVPGSTEVEFTAVHPAAPLRQARMADWRYDLEALPGADREGPMRILAGDFNATLDHRILRDLIDTGYVDPASATGNGLVGTWQAVGPISRFVPPIALDRVLVDDRIAVRDMSVHRVNDSDHRAVVVVVQLP